jgi:arylsulfatase A-like enzyme/Flp pilus assembly protein TadD
MPSAPKRDARSPTPRAAGRTRSAERHDRSAPEGARGFSRAWRRVREASRAVWLVGTIVLIAAVAYACWPPRAVADLRPIANQNVLLVTIDTLRADALGSYGGRAATPAIDGIAAAGVRFDFAHAHAVLTLPSHASILTGQYPFQHGVRDNSGYRLPPDARTAATLLKRAGYATGAFVGAFPLHSRFGLNVGFDDYDDRFGETRDPTEFVLPERPARVVVALARDWIRSRASQPWFAWVHVFDPHAPYRPPPPFDSQYQRPYDGEVAATDAALAPLLADVTGSTRPTLVVVTGDHGEALGDHGEQTHGLFAYESTLRVPLIVAEVGGGAPARPAQEVSDTPVRHIDILPTLLEASGQPVPADLPGRTMLPAGERHAGSARPSYFEAMGAMLNRGWAPLRGVLVEREKYIDLPIAERYDVGADAGEGSNLAGRAADRDRSLAAALRGFHAPLPGQRRTETPETAAPLRALGYVSGSTPAKSRYTEADDPKNLIAVDQEFHRGVDLYVAKHYGEALDVYRAIIDRRPDMAIAHRHLAFVLWETGRTEAAVDALKHAVATGVTSGGVVTQLGTYLAESGDAKAAIDLLRPVATGDASDLDAVNGLGIAYARAGRADEARQVFERMLTLDPLNVLALSNLGALDLQRGDVNAARRRFDAAVAADPTSSTAQAGLGVVASKTGDDATAVQAWTRAVELDATNFDALYNLGTTLAARGRLDQARPYLERFARTAPPSLYAKDLRDVTALLQGRR